MNSTEDLEDGRLDEGLNRLTFNRSFLSGDLFNNKKKNVNDMNVGFTDPLS